MRFSVIVPTRNRPAMLDRCLLKLAELDYPKTEFEVLVVDDGSDPPAHEVLERHSGQLQLRSLRLAGEGPARARNAALQQAQGEYVVFTDDDCAPVPTWLTAYDVGFRRLPAAAFGGLIVDDPENGLCGVASQMLISFLYEAQGATGGLRFYCSNNFAFPRPALLALGGFDPTFPLAAAEDRDLCARWLEQGDMQLLKTAVVYHHQQLTFARFCRQHYRYGRGAYKFWMQRRKAGDSGNRVHPMSFYVAMMRYPFSKVGALRATAITLLFGLSQVAGAAGYTAERRRSGGRLA